eukprot:scaffold10129_cov81-Skeletonema_dohrnii-CCMP3373.AAC.3
MSASTTPYSSPFLSENLYEQLQLEGARLASFSVSHGMELNKAKHKARPDPLEHYNMHIKYRRACEI